MKNQNLTGVRILNLSKWISDFWRANGRLPSSTAELQELAELNLPPPAEDSLEDPRNDAWGRAIKLIPSGNGFQLRSAGPDGLEHTADDITLNVEDPSEVR